MRLLLVGALSAITVSGSDYWPSDLPRDFNWCAAGYCSPIKLQCGSTCWNHAKMAAYETRLWMRLYPYNKSVPPPVPSFSLQQFLMCQRGGDLRDWIMTHGVYSETVWPELGSCGICSTQCAQGSCIKVNGMGGCTDSNCALSKLKGNCPSSQFQKAMAKDDPCLCTTQTEPGLSRYTHILDPYCRENFLKRNFKPCSCARMTADPAVKPLYSGEYLARDHPGIFGNLSFRPIGSDSAELDDAGYARSILQRGPSLAHIHVHPHDWFRHPDQVKKRCDKATMKWWKPNHVITMVGWNRTAEVPYWIIRNSWSALSSHTDHGFIYVAMDCQCGKKGPWQRLSAAMNWLLMGSTTGLCSDLGPLDIHE